MFDEIGWEQSLPDERVPGGTAFQTKSLRCGMGRFTLQASGRLIQHRFKFVECNRTSQDGTLGLPYLRDVPPDDVDTCFHCDLAISALDHSGRPVEYAARISHGQLEWVKPFETLREHHRERLLWKD